MAALPWFRGRWPLEQQIFFGMLFVALLSSLVASVGTGWLWTRHLRARQDQEFAHAAEVLKRATYPLHRAVLDQIRAYAGVHLATFAEDGSLLDATLELSQDDRQQLRDRLSFLQKHPGECIAIRLAGDNYRVRAVMPAYRSGRPTGPASVLILREESALWAELRQVFLPTLIAAVAAAALSLLASLIFARRITRPLVAVTAQTIRAAEDPTTDIVVPEVGNEVRDLAQAIRHLIEQRRVYEDRVREEVQIQAAHQLALGLGHQLRNMVTALRIALELHRQQQGSENHPEELEVALRQTRFIEALLRQLLTTPELAPPEKVPVAVDHLLIEAMDVLTPAFRHAGVSLEKETSVQGVWILGHRESLLQLVMNLLKNALEAVQSGAESPCVKASLSAVSSSEGSLVVEDNGAGIPDAIQGDLFRKPVTTKRDGVGLGLFVSQIIAARHGGTIRWERRGSTTRFVFTFPLLQHPDQHETLRTGVS